MSAAETRAAEVLAEHAPRPTDPACACGWDWDCREVILPSAVDFDSSRYRLSNVVRPEQHRGHVAAALSAAGCLRDDREGCYCPPCPGRGNDGHGLTHCAECCFGMGVEADLDCPTHGIAAPRDDREGETVQRVQRLLSWGVGRATGGVDRMIPASELRAALEGPVTPDGGDQPPVCPECRNGKHVNCTREALDEATDQVVPCQCPNHARTS